MQNTPTNPRAQLIIWHLTDSALPTGGFAHSAGMETFVLNGEISKADEYGRWLHGYLRNAAFNEALAVKLAVELQQAELDNEAKRALLVELDQLCHACQNPRQIRASMNSMGKRWSRVAAIVSPEDYLVKEYRDAINARELKGNPGIAAGLVLGAEGISVEEAVTAYLMQMANSMTQNAIRAIPLGQDAGQSVLVGAYDALLEARDATLAHSVADLGVVSPRLEVAQMEHEGLHSRMFMS